MMDTEDRDGVINEVIESLIKLMDAFITGGETWSELGSDCRNDLRMKIHYLLADITG